MTDYVFASDILEKLEESKEPMAIPPVFDISISVEKFADFQKGFKDCATRLEQERQAEKRKQELAARSRSPKNRASIQSKDNSKSNSYYNTQTSFCLPLSP